MRLFVLIVFVLFIGSSDAWFGKKKNEPLVVDGVDVGAVLNKGEGLFKKRLREKARKKEEALAAALEEKEEEVLEEVVAVVEVVKQVEAGEEVVTCGPVAEGEEEVEQGKVDKLIGKLAGTKFLKVAIKLVKSALKNPDSFLRKMLGKAAQNPQDADFEEGDVSAGGNVPTRLIPVLKKYVGETRTVVGYLWEFGYIAKVMNQAQDAAGEMGQIPPCAITEAVREFQRFNELEQTGKLTKETRDLMAKARCGNSDVKCEGCPDKEDAHSGGHKRKKRFSLKNKLWKNGDFKYYFYNYTTDLDIETTRVEIERGFKEWTDDAPLRFIETDNVEEADFRIFFAGGAHGDPSDFDGPGGVLAHAFYPRSGKVHYDEDETYTANTPEGTNLYYVTTHEIGHGLGLRHSVATGSIMNPYYQGYAEQIVLGADDVDAITTGYGKGSGGVYPLGAKVEAAKKLDEFGNLVVDDFCIEKFDAAINDPNEEFAYLFFGDEYIRMRAKKSKLAWMSEGYPKKISEMWPGLQGNFDAGFSDSENKISYFFKDGKVTSWDWNVGGVGEYEDVDMLETKFAGLPTDVTAVTSYWDNIIFFSGDKYWLWSEDGGVVNKDGFPSPFQGENPMQQITMAFNAFFKGYIYAVNDLFSEKYVLLRSTTLWNKGQGADLEGAQESVIQKYKFKSFKGDMNMIHRMPCSAWSLPTPPLQDL